MKIVLISNLLTPHQLPICDAIYNEPGVLEFIFLETMAYTDSLPIGWHFPGKKPKYVISYERYLDQKLLYDTSILQADAVILGSAPDAFIVPRLKQGKLTFKYSERFYKTSFSIKNFLRRLCGVWLHHGRFQKYPLYMLAASAYTAADAAIFGNYKNKCYRWGYFPAFFPHQKEDFQKSPGDFVKILWAGRMISWKHPESALSVAEHLAAKKKDFMLTFIGDGEMRPALENMVAEKNLGNHVVFLGTQTPETVRQYMDDADIFLFTSDRQEGWGAVLNEAMNSGCAVIADKAIGSVGYLLTHEKNGLVYEKAEDLPALAEQLLSPDYRMQLGWEAYQTIATQWNAQVAAERLVMLCHHLLENNQCHLFESGPCSRCE